MVFILCVVMIAASLISIARGARVRLFRLIPVLPIQPVRNRRQDLPFSERLVGVMSIAPRALKQMTATVLCVAGLVMNRIYHNPIAARNLWLAEKKEPEAETRMEHESTSFRVVSTVFSP
jgi:hypothetical protein